MTTTTYSDEDAENLRERVEEIVRRDLPVDADQAVVDADVDQYLTAYSRMADRLPTSMW